MKITKRRLRRIIREERARILSEIGGHSREYDLPAIDQQHLDAVVQDAEISFWGEVANGFPQIESGDFPPDAADRLKRDLTRAVEIWLSYNL